MSEISLAKRINRAGQWLCAMAVAVLMALPAMPSRADDTELFTQPPGVQQPIPNVMLYLDASANWNASNQGWPNSEKQGSVEIRMLKTVVAQLAGQRIAVGLMLPSDSGVDGAYVRFAPRTMADSGNVATLIGILDDIAACNFGSASGCGDQINSSSVNYSLVEQEVYRFYSGLSAVSGGPAGATTFNARRDYPGNANVFSASGKAAALGVALTGGYAFGSSSATSYSSPLSSVVPCSKNYFIMIGNGFPSGDDASAPSKIQAITGTTTTQIVIPVELPNITSSIASSATGNWTDEWARTLYSTGAAVPATSGINGSVVSYMIDVFKNAQDWKQTALFQSAATAGGGRYFAGNSETAIVSALLSVFDEVQAVNNVFASATLPVSVNVRGTNLNQVYLGVFRPDSDAGPNWPGNLKAYKLGLVGGALQLVDAAGVAALSTNTGFFLKGAVSFWTSVNTYWSFSADPTAQSPNSDSADGPLVERGGANQMLRLDTSNAPLVAANRKVYTYVGSSPAIGSPIDLTSTSTGDAYKFNTANTNLTPGLFGLSTSTEMANVVDWIRGADVNDENANGLTTDVRPRAHGDVIHSRPAVVNYNRYGDENDVAIFYGANDGLLRGAQGGTVTTLASVNGRPSTAGSGGSELWSFAAPEFFGTYPRQANDTPKISWSGTATSFATAATYATGASQVDIYPINNAVANAQVVTGSGVSSGTTVTAVNSVTGVLLGASATATASNVAVEVQPTSATISAAVNTGSSYLATTTNTGVVPTTLAVGMGLRGADLQTGTTATSVIRNWGFGLAGGATATVAASNQDYTFYAGSSSSTTVPQLMIAGGSSTAYSIGSGYSSVGAETYNSGSSTFGASIPASATIGSPTAANAIQMAQVLTGSAGSATNNAQMRIENSVALTISPTANVNCNSSVSAGSSCTFNYAAAGDANALNVQIGDRVSASSCWANATIANYPATPTVTAINRASSTRSITVFVPQSAGTCGLTSSTPVSFYQTYYATAWGASGVTAMPLTALRRGGNLNVSVSNAPTVNATSGAAVSTGLPTGSYAVRSSNMPQNGVGLPTTTTISSPAGTAIYAQTLSAAPAAGVAPAYGQAVFSETANTTVAAVCKGTVALGGTSITNPSGVGAAWICTSGSASFVSSGSTVTGPGIPAGTNTLGVVNPGVALSQPSLTGLGVAKNVVFYYPWTVNTLNGSPRVQLVSSPGFATVDSTWKINALGGQIPGSTSATTYGSTTPTTTLADKNIGIVEFVTLSAPIISGSSSTLTFSTAASQISSTPKPYFFDGPIGVYRYDAPNTGTGATLVSGDGKIIAGSCNSANSADCDQAIIFVPMRRGGRMVYAFDVTDPAAPKLLWKKGCSSPTGAGSCDAGFEEMGQAWSMPQAYNFNINGVTTPVLVFGGGYDANVEDLDPVGGARSMGRALYFVNAKTGVPIKVFKGSGTAANALSASAMTSVQQTAATAMTCSIPSDVAVLTKDPATGFTMAPFRAYVGDTCGQMWRVDTGDIDPNNWVISPLASVGSAYYGSAAGGSLTGNALAVQSRKFLFAPDVVYGGSDTRGAYHYVLVGSGDREHPFNGYGSIYSGDTAHPATQSVINRFYMFKDYNTNTNYTARSPAVSLSAPAAFTPTAGGASRGGSFPYPEPTLYDTTADLVQLGTAAEKTAAKAALNEYYGWYVTLSAGEKVVGGATSTTSYVYFGTNKPATVTNACATNLGEARLYQIGIADAGAVPPRTTGGAVAAVTSATQRYEIVAGGGLPPTPVPVSVQINGQFVEGVIAGTKVSTPAASVLGTRVRAFVSKRLDKN